eukprot:5857277-Pyramimonas_sp.AAC.1
MVNAISTSAEFDDIKEKLSARMSERMAAFTKLVNQSMVSYFTDQFWTPAWVSDICKLNDISGEFHLIVGQVYDAKFTQDAEKAFTEAVEAARHASDLLKSQVALVVNIAKVWLCGVPLINGSDDITEQSIKAWLAGQEAQKELLVTVGHLPVARGGERHAVPGEGPAPPAPPPLLASLSLPRPPPPSLLRRPIFLLLLLTLLVRCSPCFSSSWSFQLLLLLLILRPLPLGLSIDVG